VAAFRLLGAPCERGCGGVRLSFISQVTDVFESDALADLLIIFE
jgi:hypothetical protein